MLTLTLTHQNGLVLFRHAAHFLFPEDVSHRDDASQFDRDSKSELRFGPENHVRSQDAAPLLLCHRPHPRPEVRSQRQFTYSGVFIKKGVAKCLNSATWNAAHRFPLDRLSQKSEPRCIVTNHTEKSLGALWKSQQEVRHFAFSGHFGHISHFYFAVLVPGLSSHQRLIKMSVITTTWTYKLTERSIFRHTVWPWRGVKVWLNAMKTRGSVSRT